MATAATTKPRRIRTTFPCRRGLPRVCASLTLKTKGSSVDGPLNRRQHGMYFGKVSNGQRWAITSYALGYVTCGVCGRAGVFYMRMCTYVCTYIHTWVLQAPQHDLKDEDKAFYKPGGEPSQLNTYEGSHCWPRCGGSPITGKKFC